jgi:hypothetical protein
MPKGGGKGKAKWYGVKVMRWQGRCEGETMNQYVPLTTHHSPLTTLNKMRQTAQTRGICHDR